MVRANFCKNTRKAYKVVKFIVKVKLIEKRVNSHVGRVIVVKVMAQ